MVGPMASPSADLVLMLDRRELVICRDALWELHWRYAEGDGPALSADELALRDLLDRVLGDGLAPLASRLR